MKIVFAIDHLGPGGAQRQAVELAIALRHRLGVDARLVTYHPHDHYGERLAEAGVERELLPRRGRLDLRFPSRLADSYRRTGTDVVHAFMPGPALWSALAVRRMGADRPLLLAGERTGRLASERGKGLAEAVSYRLADAVTANARPMLDTLAKSGIRRDRLHYLPNGIDVEAWDEASRRPCPVALDPAHWNLALVGSLHPQKNHETLIDALAAVPAERRQRWRLSCFGAATAGEAFAAGLRQRVAERGLADVVSFHDPVKDVPALMSRLSALVMPSRWEGFPNVLLEAMTSGLPSVVTPVGDVPSIIEPGETSLLVEDPEDVPALTRALIELDEMGPEARERMGRAARARVEERYRVEVVARQHLDLYRELLGRRAPRQPG
ncbi:MAG: glycosyltransferase [Myxococcota bacterium]|nr:glycosyltransferase [Myxococcota bacterium]